MAYKPFLIANTRVGMERDIEPFLLPNDAYVDLEDCWLFRGRVIRRQGFSQVGRLNLVVVTVNSGLTTVTFTLKNVPLTHGSSQFVVGSVIIQDLGTGVTVQTDGASSTIDYTLGTVVITLAAPVGVNTNVFYYPGEPVMGLATLETTTLDEESLIAFDTNYSYLYSTGSSSFENITAYKPSALTGAVFSNPFIWHGANYQQFWAYNYQAAMFVTNDVPGLDGIKYTSLTHGNPTTLHFGASPAAFFTTGDYVFIVPDSVGTTTFDFTYPSGLKQIPYNGGIATVAGNDITVPINSTGDSGAGTLYNLTRQIGTGPVAGPTTVGDGVKWLDQNTITLPGWVNFQPPLNSAAVSGTNVGTTFLQGALMIFPYRNRLVMLNTYEGTQAQAQAGTTPNFAQRARWSQNGTVYYANPLPTNYQGGIDPQAWRSDIVGKGGFIDAPTLEEIVSAEFVKDTLVVYFESSTWTLQYTNNEVLPFVWVRVNTELGAISTFSVVPFDRTTIAVGNVGIHACDTVNVQRIDQKIPDEVFQFQIVSNGAQRISGIRDYINQVVYWSIPYLGYTTENEDDDQTVVFPNKLLIYNYIDQNFAFFNDSFTCFGYFQPSTMQQPTWSVPDLNNPDLTWEQSDFLWNAVEDNPEIDEVIAGNQCGYVLALAQKTANSDSLFITNMVNSTVNVLVTCINHNLTTEQYVKVTAASGTKGLLNKIFQVQVVTANTFLLLDAQITGTFSGNGSLTLMNNFSIQTKRFSPFFENGMQVRIGRMDNYVAKTSYGQITINLYINEDSATPINFSSASLPSSGISNITAANPVVITVANGSIFAHGNVVIILGTIFGMVEIQGLSSVVQSVAGNNVTLDLDGSTFTAYTSGGVLENVSSGITNNLNTFPESTYAFDPDKNLNNDKLWKRINFHDISQTFQFEFTLNDVQMRAEPISVSDFQLHGMMPYFSPAGRIIDV